MKNTIRAWKPAGGASLTVCDLNDEEAVQFEISYYVYGCGFSSQITFDSLFKAEGCLNAMRSAHEAGRRAAFADFRNMIKEPQS